MIDPESANRFRYRGNDPRINRRKELAYLRGFRQEAKLLGIDPGQGHCPYSIQDDPTISAAAAFDLGRCDARDAARGRSRTA